MTPNKKEDVDTNQCQTQVDQNLTMNASTNFPVVKMVHMQRNFNYMMISMGTLIKLLCGKIGDEKHHKT